MTLVPMPEGKSRGVFMTDSCKCGCGLPVRQGSVFVHGHNRRGFKHSVKAKQKISLVNKGLKRTEEQRKRNAGAQTGKKHSEETRRKMSNAQSGEKHHMWGKKHTEVAKLKMSQTRKGVPSPKKGVRVSEETKKKMSDAFRGRKLSEEHKAKLTAKLKGRPVSLTTRKKIAKNNSETHKKKWADPVFHKEQQSKMMRGRHTRPNKPEIELLELLQKLYPNDWKYVGDGNLVIAGKNPDFVNVNGKKLLIELFGDYWHRNDSPRKRAAVFKPFGFRTLVIWQHELKNKTNVIRRIRRFVA